MVSDFAVIDFETAYDKDYSLSKMPTDAYVLDPRFEIIGVSVKRSAADPIEWFSGTKEETKAFLKQAIDWKTAAVCCHNTLFDGFICTTLGLRPKLWMDTLGMARATFPWLKSHSLASVADYLGIGAKGGEVLAAIGKRRADFSQEDLAKYGEYCKNDTALTHTIATLLVSRTPALELKIIDMTIRMFTEPRLRGNVDALQTYYEQELRRKEDLLAATEADKDSLMSNPKFADRLRELGVDPPMKISARTGKQAYAFSKTDKALSALLDHENPEVQALVAARLGVKTTIAETRAMTLLTAAKRGPLPVYLNYWGAKTTGRHSGGNRINYQNIPARGAGSEIRNAMVAPKGYTVVVGDSSNIELRVALAAAGQVDALDKLAAGKDLYCDFASRLFGREITKEDKTERMLGKISMLSLQYGAGAARFKEMVRIQAKIALEDSEAERIVNLYRTVHSKVQKLWWYCGSDVLPSIHNMQLLVPVDVNGWFLTNELGFSLPGSPGVCYNSLKKDVDGQWSYESGRTRVKIYGAKVVENLCQHAARHIVMWQTARIHEKFPVALSVHDEAVCIVKDEQVQECVDYMAECLSLAPKWCRGMIPLECEVGYGKSYGSAK
jgi:DNA polymerase I-like protein with 3'-5' exonuclease and polymerase domains